MNVNFLKNLWEKDSYAKAIALAIGEPINLALPSPMELDAICNTVYVEAGEKTWSYQGYDTDAGEILVINTTTGAMIPVKRSPVDDTQITLVGYQSKQEHVLIDTILSASDQGVIARKKEIIVDNLDKKEVRLVCQAIVNASSGSFGALNIQSETLDSGEDIYDTIQDAINKTKDYSDGGALLVGTVLDNAIDNWDKAKASTFNYQVNIKGVNGLLARNNVSLIRVFGTVRETDGGSLNVLLDAESGILVGTNSRRKLPKPITFVRRKIDAQLAAIIGATSANPSRLILTLPAPVNNSGVPTWAIGTYAYEQIAVVITDPNRIVTLTDVGA